MKKVVKATTGRSTSMEYIKNKLFDIMCEDYFAEINGVPANEVAERVEALGPYFDIDDVEDLMYEEGLDFVDALKQIESDLEDM